MAKANYVKIRAIETAFAMYFFCRGLSFEWTLPIAVLSFILAQVIVDAASVAVHFTLGELQGARPLPLRTLCGDLARAPRCSAYALALTRTTRLPLSPARLPISLPPADNYFSRTTKGIGNAVHFFREHHKYPYLMLERDWIDTNAEITAACLCGCVLLACILQPIGLLDGSFWNLVAAWGSLCGPTISSVHALTHLKDPPAWYRVGSYFGVVCTKEHHKKHHEAFRTCYSLYLGLVDTFFDSCKVLEGIELFIYIGWGVIAVNTRLDHFMFLDGETTFQQRWCNAKANWTTALRSSCASRGGVVTFACTSGAAEPREWGGAGTATARTAKVNARDAKANGDAGAAKRDEGAARGGTASRVVERLDLALYKRVLAATSLREKTIVDVSCGAGNSLVALATDPNPNAANAPKECIGIRCDENRGYYRLLHFVRFVRTPSHALTRCPSHMLFVVRKASRTSISSELSAGTQRARDPRACASR